MKSQILSRSYIQLENAIPKSERGKIKLFWFLGLDCVLAKTKCA